jgi:hypothetical protein
MYLLGVDLTGRGSHWTCTPLACASWSLGVHPMDVHLMGVVCVEAFRFFNLVFGKKSLYPTVALAEIQDLTCDWPDYTAFFGNSVIIT